MTIQETIEVAVQKIEEINRLDYQTLELKADLKELIFILIAYSEYPAETMELRQLR